MTGLELLIIVAHFVECLTWESTGVTGGTVVYPPERHFILCLTHRKTGKRTP